MSLSLPPFLKLFQKPSLFSPTKTVWCAESICGLREENQDNCLLITPHYRANEQKIAAKATRLEKAERKTIDLAHWQQPYFRLAVADGMGGHEGGQQIAEALIKALCDLPPQRKPSILRDKITAIHERLLAHYAQDHLRSPGTTLVMADIQASGEAVIANVGDSRAYVWREQRWQQITYDQTLNEYDWRDDTLEGEVYNPQEKSHRLAQAMGYGSYGLIKNEYNYRPRQLNRHLRLDLAEELPTDKQHPDIFTLKLAKGEALLLASDGLWSVPAGKSPLVLPPPKDLATQDGLQGFLQKVQENGSSDNMTAVMLSAPLGEVV
ncbi:MAG: PP2C family protein-serine/threonine phosphatase [bacterium]